MKSHQKPSFNQILKSVSLCNVRNLIQKAELAAGIAWHYPNRREMLRKIEQGARAQLQAITGLGLSTAAAAD